MKKTLFALHRWLGLFSGMVLLLIGLSGSLLLFKTPLERLLAPTLYKIAPGEKSIPVDSAYAVIRRICAGRFASCSFDLPEGPDGLYEFTLEPPRTGYFSRGSYLVDIHPFTGAILREGPVGEVSTSFVRWLMSFHDSFQLGRAGMLVAVLASVSVLLSTITGLLFYGKRILGVLTFRFRLRSENRMLFWRSLHVYVGVWALLFNAVVAFTGFWMMKSTLAPRSWSQDPRPPSLAPALSIDSCLLKSRQVLPGFIPDFVAISFLPGSPLEIDGEMENSSRLLRGDASYVIFDPAGGGVIGSHDATKEGFPDILAGAVWPLHTGNYGGFLLRIGYALGGLAPGVLSCSGYLVWWRRKRLYAVLQR